MLVDRFSAFGFIPIEVNGHDIEEIKGALHIQLKTPTIVVAHTISDVENLTGQAAHYDNLKHAHYGKLNV